MMEIKLVTTELKSTPQKTTNQPRPYEPLKLRDCLLTALLATTLLSAVTGPCGAADYRDVGASAIDSEQVDQLASNAAATSANSIRPSYRTIGELIADYDRGRKQLDSALIKIGASFVNAPLPYLNNQSRLQYRDSLLGQINSYDTRISQLVNHDRLEARAQEHLPVVQAKFAAMARTVAAPLSMPVAVPILGFLPGLKRQLPVQPMNQAMAQQLNDPVHMMQSSREEVIDTDNEQAAELQALRNKMQQQVDAIMAAQLMLNNQIREVNAHAVVVYDHFVVHKIAALSNTTEPLKKQAASFVEKEELNDRAELQHVQMVAARSTQPESTDAVRAGSMVANQSVSVTSANNVVAPQYYPGPNGIGGKTIPGLAIAQPAQLLQPATLSQPNFHQIPTVQFMQMTPMQMLPPPRQNFGLGYR